MYKLLQDIPQFPRSNHLQTTEWTAIEDVLARYTDKYNLNLDPDYQREHVWTLDKRIKYIEYCLKGGEGSKIISFNKPDVWSKDNQKYLGTMELMDGKQRLETVRMFLRDEFPVFDKVCSEFEDQWHLPSFTFQIFGLKTREEILSFYLNINSGGVVHTQEELDKVRKMLKEELNEDRM